MVCAQIYLLYNMQKYFKKELSAETCRLKGVFSVFTLAYLTRATWSLIV